MQTFAQEQNKTTEALSRRIALYTRSNKRISRTHLKHFRRPPTNVILWVENSGEHNIRLNIINQLTTPCEVTAVLCPFWRQHLGKMRWAGRYHSEHNDHRNNFISITIHLTLCASFLFDAMTMLMIRCRLRYSRNRRPFLTSQRKM